MESRLAIGLYFRFVSAFTAAIVGKLLSVGRESAHPYQINQQAIVGVL